MVCINRIAPTIASGTAIHVQTEETSGAGMRRKEPKRPRQTALFSNLSTIGENLLSVII
ncbi:hypothetical protein KKB58_02450 [Patescibacteria group bacterium]|nr:hypothetical protein [Patescibacteria group bacterium]